MFWTGRKLDVWAPVQDRLLADLLADERDAGADRLPGRTWWTRFLLVLVLADPHSTEIQPEMSITELLAGLEGNAGVMIRL
jgi:hypothetical protein